MTTGWLLGDGELAPTYIGYGWPLVLAPIMRLAGPSFITAMPPVIALNVLVLGPLALWAIYGLGARIAGRAFGLLAAAVWVVMPFAVIPLWRDDYHERYVEQFLPGALGLTGLVDYQSMVLLLVGALLFMRALETRATLDSTRRRPRDRLRDRREAVERPLRRRPRRCGAAGADAATAAAVRPRAAAGAGDAGPLEATRARHVAGVRARGVPARCRRRRRRHPGRRPVRRSRLGAPARQPQPPARVLLERTPARVRPVRRRRRRGAPLAADGRLARHLVRRGLRRQGHDGALDRVLRQLLPASHAGLPRLLSTRRLDPPARPDRSARTSDAPGRRNPHIPSTASS